jgi:phosphopantothenate synthetase
VPIVDELTRALPNVEKFVRELRRDPEEAERVARTYDRAGNLRAVYSFLNWRLRHLTRGTRRRRR